jgi:uncharacterized protein (DUF433 family)
MFALFIKQSKIDNPILIGVFEVRLEAEQKIQDILTEYPDCEQGIIKEVPLNGILSMENKKEIYVEYNRTEEQEKRRIEQKERIKQEKKEKIEQDYEENCKKMPINDFLRFYPEYSKREKEIVKIYILSGGYLLVYFTDGTSELEC